MKRRHFVLAEDSDNEASDAESKQLDASLDANNGHRLNHKSPEVVGSRSRSSDIGDSLTISVNAIAPEPLNHEGVEWPSGAGSNADATEPVSAVSTEVIPVTPIVREDAPTKVAALLSNSSPSCSDDSSVSETEQLTFTRKKPRGPANTSIPSRRDAALSLLEQERNALQPIQTHSVDDTDGTDPEAELRAWQQRQLARQQRDRALTKEAERELARKFAARGKRLKSN